MNFKLKVFSLSLLCISAVSAVAIAGMIKFHSNVPGISALDGEDLASASVAPRPAIASNNAKALVLVFLSSRCPCSAAHEETLKKLALKYQSEGFEFLGIHSNQDEPLDAARDHFSKAGLPFPVLQDSGGALAKKWGALKTPHAFILQKEGQVVFSGGVSDRRDPQDASRNYLQEAMDDLKAAHSVRTPHARALGCVIVTDL